MEKEALLQELAAKVRSGELRPDEVLHRLKLSPARKEKTEAVTRFSVAKMLYIIGATIVVIGILFFVSQIWSDIGAFGRIIVTLGLGLLLTALGSMLLTKKPQDTIGTVFHAIGGMLIPGGALVTLSELSVETFSVWPVAITFGVIFGFYLALNAIHKSPVLTFFAIANGTAFTYLLVEAIVSGSFNQHEDLYAYLTMVIGISYLLLAHAFRDGWNSVLLGVLSFFGITGFLGAGYSQVFDSVPWQLLYFLLVGGGFALAVYSRNRSILVMSTVFLIAHVSYITSEYFADSIGWPISLVLLGFFFVGLGYASITINRRYIAGGKA
ncbi:MAG: DUF2157 domain-containing protein [Candidatus Peribacteraceae bacterium]|nr:DUF2157 domain-containing protein [Candidatus Peribacteraceae bacterium]